jgi:ABC-2 type transport system permease protein
MSFMTLFSATLVSKDRESAFLQRLYTTPMTGLDFVLGYMLPMLPIGLGQTVICYAAAAALGMDVTVELIYAIIGMVPVAVFNIALGLMCGSILSVKQVGGICGALLTNLTAWLSGVWFDLSLVGGVFEKIAGLLPFVHGVQLQKSLLGGGLPPRYLLAVTAYAAAATTAAVWCFLRQTKKQ